MLSDLARAGASQAYLSKFGAELALIEEVLGGDEFAQFIQPHLAALGMEAPLKPAPALPAHPVHPVQSR